MASQWYDAVMEKPATVKTTVYVPAEVWEQLRQVAKAHRRSLNSEMVWALQQYLDQQSRKRPDA
jgi:predicted transcriptional regulator